jgi:phosphatidate phosphatase PAH1
MYYMCLLVLLQVWPGHQEQQWVHYRCLKLNSEEITAIENTEGKNYYICKLCIEKDKTTCTSPVYILLIAFE